LTLLVKHLPADWQGQIWSLDGGPFAAELKKAGICLNVHSRRWRWDVLPAVSLWRLISQWKPDVVHSYGYMSTLAAVLPCRLLRLPLVDGTIRQANVPAQRGRIWRWSLRWADRIIANSEAGLRAFHVSPERGRVVYNGFDPARWLLCRRVARDADTPFRVIMVARMHPMKDYDTLVCVARQLAAGRDELFEFWAVGAGPRRKILMESVIDLSRRGTFLFPEPTQEVLPYVRQADVGVLMTRAGEHTEGCSNAIMEYMACGLPVICSDSGGNRELVIDGETGFIVRPGDAEQVYQKLSWLWKNPLEAEKMGQAGRQRILQGFTVDKLVGNTLAVYHEVLDR
jgi:glycosyltransferase involved in cell wall biosynthesis